jgi:L-alanine-DL-glutamate epimerase-like enolase superfamily enzyme
MKQTDITITAVEIDLVPYNFRTPLKFGGVVLDQVTDLNATVRIKNRDGKEAVGFGSMPMSNLWAFPSKVLPFDETRNAMLELAGELRTVTESYNDYAHPVEINHTLEPLYLDAANRLSTQKGLQQPIPKLCTLVTASPFDAAIHDAYGKLLGLNCFSTYSSEFMNHDVSYFLNDEFKGESLSQYVLTSAKPEMALYHLVGALDPLTDADIQTRINDGLPETLPEWIQADGLTHLKIKLNGDNLDWDVNRVASVDRITEETQAKRGIESWHYSLDFNERCENVDYLLAFLHHIQEKAPNAMNRVQYIEQPTARDLRANPENKMHKAAAIKPVVIDESLEDFETLLLAREQGYSGVALKACKGQSQSLLMAAAAQKYNMFLCVQDLTCPGASFLHSVSLAVHIPGIVAIEGNSRQYCPSANDAWRDKFPTVFNVKNGRLGTSCLDGIGLGIVPPQE